MTVHGGRFRGSNDPYLEPLLTRHSSAKYSRRKRLTCTAVAVAVAAFSATSLYLAAHLPSSLQPKYATSAANVQGLWGNGGASNNVVSPGISLESFQYGLSKCQAISSSSDDFSPLEATQVRSRNPRSAGNTTLLIKNGHIWLGDRYLDGDILVSDGLIRQVGPDIEVEEVDQVIDAEGRAVTPGIVDMHSHMTVDSFPGLDNLADENEMTHPTTPYVRALDAINPSDPAIKIVASGGVTTSLILPGSGNLMGGEAAVIKLRPVRTLSNRDMLVTAGVRDNEEKVWRYMKMACGENPKSYYGAELNRMPKTRMGESYLFRRRFEEAQALKRAQDDWCDAAFRINKTIPTDRPVDENTITRLSEPFPESLKLESLVALLRHQVKLNVHCYLPQDIEAMVDHSLEFDFEIAAFHHALSAWQVTDVIKRAKTNVTIATFADMWGYKAEAWDQNVHAPNILSDAGIPVAFKSDHPVMNARDLIHEAQKAYHYGFDEHKALAAVTSVPAAALELGHRIGSIEVGKDADIVIWERHPLRLGARPKHVIIDGMNLDFHASWTKHADELVNEEKTEEEETQTATMDEEDETRHWLPPRPTATIKLEDHGLDNPMRFSEACSPSTDSFVLRNISRMHMGPGQTLEGNLYVVVKEGNIVCAGTDCDRDHVDWPAASPVFEMGGAVVLPGIISTGVPLGLGEIIAEPSTLDGFAENDVQDARGVARAIDGLKLNGLHLQKAFKAGVTTSISQPLVGSGVLAGVSVAFRTGVENTVLDANDALVRDEAALHFVISHSGKSTVSQQIAAIRDLLLSNFDKDPSTNVYARAAQGKLPVVIETDDKDEIASIAQMKQQLLPKGPVNFVILGGAEAHLVADHLSRLDIPVVLMPARCYPSTWQARLCLTGPPVTPSTGLDILLKRGVRVAVASTDSENGDARNLIWEAGWNRAHNPLLTEEEAVGLVTWNVADMFGIADESGLIRVNRRADFVAYNGDPFEFGTQVLMVYGGGHSGPVCFPKQI